MDTLYVVMPAYNEEENIEKVIEDWYPVLDGKSEDSRIVIADSGSSDRTHEILLKLRDDRYPKLEIIDTKERYHGPKVIALYKYAMEHGADYVFHTDSDGQTDPNEFDSFWDQRDTYVGLFGNRTKREDGRDRAGVEKIVCILLKLYFGVDIPDANAPFRLMKADVLKSYIDRMADDYAIPNIMITTFFVYYKESCAFPVISFKPRMKGTDSINMMKILKIGIRSLKDFHSFKKAMR